MADSSQYCSMTIDVFRPERPVAPARPQAHQQVECSAPGSEAQRLSRTRNWRSDILGRPVVLTDLSQLSSRELELLISELDITIEISRTVVRNHQTEAGSRAAARIAGVCFRAAIARGFFRAALRERMNRMQMRDRNSQWGQVFQQRLLKAMQQEMPRSRAQELITEALWITARILGQKKERLQTAPDT
jgi:hypothetical protein